MTAILIKRRNLVRDRHTQGEHKVSMKAEIGVMLLQARECQRYQKTTGT